MAEIQITDAPKHKIYSGDFFIVLAVIVGFLLTGGIFFTDKSEPVQKSDTEQTIITGIPKDANSNLKLQTFTVEECSSTAAVDFLIDNSGSMQFGSKMAELKRALTVFANRFPPTGAIAMQTYSEEVQTPVDFGIFKEQKSNFLEAVNDMQPQTATHSKDAFEKAAVSLEDGKNKFPQYNFSLIFISDGIPESRAANNACVGGIGGGNCVEHPKQVGACRCYDDNQDPTAIAAELKAKGVHIYTISFVDPLDEQLNTKLQNLMRTVASSPSDYYQAPVETQLTTIVSQIATQICHQK